MEDILVIKLNLDEQETWRYTGEVLARDAHSLTLRALFNRADTPFHGILLRQGDIFIEIYFTDRWYNIFQIHDRDSAAIKGWYCNVAKPAEIEASQIRYVDLALDLLVYPDGRQLVLDEDEYEALHPDETLRARASAALAELKTLVQPQNGFLLA
jgi:predicted RNA-binding protein associated with RNAse of E/G family